MVIRPLSCFGTTAGRSLPHVMSYISVTGGSETQSALPALVGHTIRRMSIEPIISHVQSP